MQKCLAYFTRLWNERVNATPGPDLVSMLATWFEEGPFPMAIQLGCYLLALAGLLAGFIWGTIRAFRSGVWWGLTFLFLPFGWVAYLVRHGREAWPPVLLGLSGAGLLLVTAGSPRVVALASAEPASARPDVGVAGAVPPRARGQG